MKPKQIIVLAVILSLLVAAVVFQKVKKPTELQTEEYSTLDFNFDASKASKVVIQKGESEKLVELTQEGGNWKVSSFLNASVDRGKIDSFLKQIREAKGELRGRDKSLFSDFKISDAEAFRIIISDQTGAVLSKLILGAQKSNGATFIRKAGSDAVYYVHADLFGAMGFWGDLEKEKPKSDYWALLNPLGFKAEEVERLEITRFKDGKASVMASVFRETNPNDNTKKIWKYAKSKTDASIDAEKVKRFLTSIFTWYAARVLDPKEKDFSKPILQIKLGLEGQKEVLMTVVQEGKEAQNVYVQIAAEQVIFEYSSSFLKHLDIDDGKFAVDAPQKQEPQKKD